VEGEVLLCFSRYGYKTAPFVVESLKYKYFITCPDKILRYSTT
jgi:hypothetical protein